MSAILESFLQCFIPLFVAINALGVVPLFLGLTEGRTEAQKRTLITQATATAFVVAVGFLVLGKGIFSFLGISEDDFRVGGGILLLVIAVSDLAFSTSEARRKGPDDTVGIVPIGIPLIIGPAALTTILLLMDSHGPILTLITLLLNLAIVWMVFRHSERIVRVIGKAGSRAIEKVASLFLAAIAVKMIRMGLTATFGI